MELKEAQVQWEKLHKDWVFAEQSARRIEAKNLTHFRQCAQGQGTGPNVEDLELAEKLRRVADEAKLAADGLIRQLFG